MSNKPILCLDFDGVCHSYTSGWQGADICGDPPVERLFEALRDYQEHFTIQIYSSRSHQEGGEEAMINWFYHHYEEWLKQNNEDFGLALLFPRQKPPAMVTIDDRALTFTGQWPDIQTLKEFKPWNKK